MGVTYKLSDEEKKRAGRFLEIIQEQKEIDNRTSTNQNVQLPTANKLTNNILPNVRLATAEERRMKQKIINKSSAVDKIGYVGKKGLTGLASGTAGIAQAGLTDIANNLEKGNSKSGAEVTNNLLESTMGLLNPLQGYNKYIKNLPSMIGNVFKTINDKDTNAIEKVASLGTTAVSDALSNNVARDVLNLGVQLAGKVLPSDASEKMLGLNKKISEPIEKINQDLYIEGQNYDKATQFIGDATQVVGNMVPSIATTAITKNPNIGLLTMGVSAKGQSTQEAMNRGATLDEAIKIGDTKGAIEVATEMLTGGVNIFGKGALDDIVEKGIKDKIKSKVGKYLLQKGYQLGGEVLEETISDVLGTVIDKGTVDPNATYSIEDWGDTAVTTILSTLILNTITGGIGKVNNYDYNTQQKLQEAQNIIDNVNNKNNVLNVQQEQLNSNINIQNQQVTPVQNKVSQNGLSTELNDILNNKQLPMQSFQYEESGNTKIDNLRKEASKYFNNSEQTKNFVNMLEKIIADKNVEIRLDSNLITTDGKVANGSYSNGIITINPNSNRAGEFIAIHELTHAIGTKQMISMIENYKNSNLEFESSIQDLLNNYNMSEINEEALADISGQLFGNQEFINNMANTQPNIFQKIYSEIKYLWHQFRGYKNQNQFVEDLYYKWTQAYNSNSRLNYNSYYSIQTDNKGNRYVKVDTDQHIFDGIDKKDYNKIAKMYMQDYLMGKTTLSNNDNAIIDNRSTNKYTNPRQRTSYMNEKMQLTPELKNVLEIAQKDSMSLPTKENSKYKSWEYYKFNFELGGRNFEGTINIGIDKEGNKHFYEINKIHFTGISSVSTNSQHKTDFINNSILPTNKNVNNTTKYSIQNKEKNTQNRINENQIPKEIYNKLRNEKLYFRFDDEGGFRGKEHMSGVAMWEDTIIDKINENNKGYYDENDNYIEKNSLLERYGVTQEQYDNMNNEQQFKINQKIAIDEGLVTNGASVFELTEDGLDFFERYDSDHYETDYPQFNIFAGKHNGWGADGESVVIPSEVFYTGKTQEISDILYDYELTNQQKIDKILDLIQKTYSDSRKMNNANSQYSIQKSGNNSKWQDYLEKNFKPTGSRTNLQDIRMPISKKVQADINMQKFKEANNIKGDIISNTIAPINEKIQEKKVASILSKTPKKVKESERKWAIFKANIFDKGIVFEELAHKTNNRELQGKWDYILSATARGQNAIGNARYEFDNTTKQLRRISKSLEEIKSNVGDKVQYFSEYMYHQLNIDRMTLEERFGGDTGINYERKNEVKNKPVFGESVTADISQNIVMELEQKYPEFKSYAQDVYDFLNANMKELVDNGVVSKESAEHMSNMYPHYVPIGRINVKGDAISVPLDTGRTGIDTPIKSAKGGNRDIVPLFDTIAQRTLQTYRASARNNFGVELMNTLNTISNIENVDVDTVIETMGQEVQKQELLQEGKNGNAPTFTVFENGKRITYEITKDMYDAFRPVSDSSLLGKTIKPLNKLSNFRRGVLTEYNPLFMITNAIKDAQDVLINSQHSAKTYAKFPEAYAQIVKKGYWYQEYVQNGGEQNSYFNANDNIFESDVKKSKLKGAATIPLRAISNVNNVIELAPRLAEYIASRESGRSIETSMLDASRVTTNFKAGGDVTKFANRNGITFLNASVQGMMQQVRNITEAHSKGLKGYAVLATKYAIAGLPAIIFNNLIWGDDDDYDELQDYVKDNYYCIAKYGEGQFIRIPKGRMLATIQKVVSNASEYITDNKEINIDNFAKDFWEDLQFAMDNVAPNNPLDNNVISPIIQTITNTSWYGEDIVPSRLQDKPKAEQYDETIDSFSIWLGQKLNVSPYKINYLLDQYGGGISDIALPKMTKQAENNPIEDKFTTNSVMKSKYPGEFFEKVDELKVNNNSEKATDEDKIKYKYMSNIQKDMSDLYDKKRKIQNSNDTDKEKKEKLKGVQKQINILAKNALAEVNNLKLDGITAKIDTAEYYKATNLKDGSQEWKKVSDEEAENNKNISLKTYANYKEKVAQETIKQRRNGNIKEDSNLKNKDKIKILINSNYSDKEREAIYKEYINSEDKKIQLVDKLGLPLNQYLKYKQQEFENDKDEDGETISGTKKQKVYDYLNNIPDKELPMIYKQMICKLENINNYNSDIVNYVIKNAKESEQKELLEILGFKVDKNGNIQNTTILPITKNVK